MQTQESHGRELPSDVGEPDFDNLLAVLRREVPARSTLFEFFLNDRLYERLAPLSGFPDGPYRQERQVVAAFRRAGYDYGTVLVPGFEFHSGRVKVGASVSLNEGAVVRDRAGFEAYDWPDIEGADFGILDGLAPDLPPGMKLIGHAPGGVLENSIELLGYDALCYLLADDMDLVQAVFDEVGARLVSFYELLATHDSIGAVIANDDWGFKTHTFLSPAHLRRLVFPWYKRIVAVAHAAGKPVILHSCGHFERIVDDIVDVIGCDARHSYEDAILSVEDAYDRYHGRMAILGGIDVDFVARSSPERVYERSKAVLERSAAHGGYALGTGNSVPDYIPDANYFAMTRAALETRG